MNKNCNIAENMAIGTMTKHVKEILVTAVLKVEKHPLNLIAPKKYKVQSITQIRLLNFFFLVRQITFYFSSILLNSNKIKL